jgi:hypothetical protein
MKYVEIVSHIIWKEENCEILNYTILLHKTVYLD